MGNKSSRAKGGSKGGKDSGGGDALIAAAKVGDIAKVTELIQSGECDIDDRCDGEYSNEVFFNHYVCKSFLRTYFQCVIDNFLTVIFLLLSCLVHLLRSCHR